MRICQVVTYDVASPCGGVKHHAIHLAAALREQGDDVEVIGPASTPAGAGIHGFPGVVNIPANGSDNFIGLFVSPWAVRRFFAPRRFDIVHVHEPIVPVLSPLAVWNTPRAAHVATFHAYDEGEPWLARTLRRAAAPVVFHRFVRGIAVSRPAARLAAGTWRGPLTVIPNGVPTDIFRPAEYGSSGSGALRLLFVGRLGDRRKGIRFLVDAYRRLVGAGIPLSLDIVGELGGTEPPPELPGLTFHGALPLRGLVERYRAADLFVAPATGQESFGLVLLEAMACGLPILCSDIEGFRQVAAEDGARFVPPADSAALADAIARLAAGPAALRRMGERNRRRALNYDWSRIAGRVREEYVAALEERAASHRLSSVQPAQDVVAKSGFS